MVLIVVKIVNELERTGDRSRRSPTRHSRSSVRAAVSVRSLEIARRQLAEDNLQLALDAFARLDVAAAA